MKQFFLALVFVAAFSASAWAAGGSILAVQQADAARVKATISGDARRLAELLSDDLSYGQNDGRIQTKAEFVGAVTSNRVKYEAFDYEDAKFVETAPGVVTMTGLVHLKVSRGSTRVEFTLRFLAVWRDEKGQWRLHAYQSSRVPDTTAPSATTTP